jgi:hypothetical protein
MKELLGTLLVVPVMRERAWIDSSTTGYQPIKQIWVFLRA